MKTRTSGMTTLMVLGIVTVVMLLVTAAWRTVWLSRDLVVMRQQYEQRLRSTEGLVMVGVALGRRQFDMVKQQGKPVEIMYNTWPVGDGREYQGRVILEGKGGRVFVTGYLLQNNRNVFQVSCFLSADKKGDDAKVTYAIEQWKIGV